MDKSAATSDQRAERVPYGTLRREGGYWTVEYGGTICRLRDASGLRHIALLLSRPGQRVAATDLVRTALPRWDKRRRARLQADGSVAAAVAAAEQARIKVTRAIRAAMRRIAAHNALLGEHLTATIRTGVYCSYAPSTGHRPDGSRDGPTARTDSTAPRRRSR